MTTDGRSCDTLTRSQSALQCGGWSNSARTRVLLAAVAFCLSLVAGLGSVGIWGAREQRLAACVADVARTGHWLVPNLWGRPRLEKPPLPYWASAAAVVLTGQLNEWTLRLPALMAAILILVSVYYLGSEAGGPSVGLIAVLFLLSSFYFVTELRQPSSDLYLTAFSSAALACWWRGRRDDDGRFRWWSLAGLCVGLAGACKGSVVLAIIGPPILAMWTWERRLPLPRTRAAWTGIALAIGVTLAWPAAVLHSEPAAWKLWFREQQIAVAHSAHWWNALTTPHYYLWRCPEYLFPWSVFAVGGIRWGFARRSSNLPPVVRFAWWWFFGDLLLFTLFTARKNYYLMPAVPGLAVLAAYTARFVTSHASSRYVHLTNRIAHHSQLFLLVAAGFVGTYLAWSRLEQVRWLGVATAVALTLTSALILARSFLRPRQLSLYAVACLSVCLTIGVAYTFVLPTFDERKSDRPFVRQVSARLPEHAVIYFWGEPKPALWFYLDHELRQVNRLAADMENATEAFCLVTQRHLELQPDLSPRLELIVTDQNREESDRLVLARLRLPLQPGTQVYSGPDPLVRHYKQRSDKPRRDSRVARAMTDSSEAPKAPGSLNR